MKNIISSVVIALVSLSLGVYLGYNYPFIHSGVPQQIVSIIKPDGTIVCDKAKYESCEELEKTVKDYESIKKSQKIQEDKISNYCYKMYGVKNKIISLKYETYDGTDNTKCGILTK